MLRSGGHRLEGSGGEAQREGQECAWASPASNPASSTAWMRLRGPVLSGLNCTSAFPRRRLTETLITPESCGCNSGGRS